MRTLRYLGVLEKTGLKGNDAENLLEVIKSMPELLGQQEKRYLIQYGIPMHYELQETKTQVLEWFRSIGLNVYITEKVKFIKETDKRAEKVKEINLRVGRYKTIFNCDLETASYMVRRFIEARRWSSTDIYERTYDDYKIQAKVEEDGREYFVIFKYK